MKMSILNHSDGSIFIEEGDKHQLIENYDLKTGVVLADKKTNHSVIIEFSIDDKGFFRISHNGDIPPNLASEQLIYLRVYALKEQERRNGTR